MIPSPTTTRPAPGKARTNPLGWLFADPLLRPAWRFCVAVMVVAGPWLIAVLTLGLIAALMAPVLGRAGVEDLILTVVYAFCIAPLFAVPVGAIAARRVTIAIEASAESTVTELYIAAAVFSGLATGAGALAICLLLGIHPMGLATAFIFLSMASALLWTSFAVFAAVRANGVMIGAFGGGMTFAILCTALSARHAPTTEMLVWCFTVGALLCVALCLRYMQWLFPGDREYIVTITRNLVADLRGNTILGAGVFFAITGVWVDKWIYWFGPHGLHSEAGFLHYAPYDSIMFLALLSIIPSYAAMMLFHQGELTDAVKRFRAGLADRSTHMILKSRVDDLGQVVWRHVVTILAIQGTITLGLVLMAPLLVGMLGLGADQTTILRVGYVGVLLHTVMISGCAILTMAGCNRHFALVYGGFLVLNLVTSLVFQALFGVTAYAFLVSSLIAAMAAMGFAYRALRAYDYLALVGENESLYAK